MRSPRGTNGRGMNMATTEQCSNCRFWDYPADQVTSTEWPCRRYAPKPGPSGNGTSTYWPLTEASDWCGEHEPIEEERPDETLEGISEDEAQRIGEAFGDAL